MKSFDEGFKLMGLPTESPADYQGAEEFAKHFEKCSMLNNDAVTYAAHSDAIYSTKGHQASKPDYYNY